MATRYAAASGNWSDTATWDGGTLPTSSDDVFADGKTVTIDQDVTVLSLRTTQRAGGTAGGGFTCATARTINCSGGNGIVAGNSTVLTLSHTSGNTVTLSGAIAGGASSGGIGVTISGSGTTNVTGNVTAGTQGTTTSVGINITGAATVSVTGNLSGNASGSSYGAVYIGAAANVTITGSVTASNSWVLFVNSATCVVTVTGAVTGAAVQGLYNNAATPSITVIGKLTAGTLPAIGLLLAANLTVSGPFISSASGVLPIDARNASVKLAAITNNEFRFLDSVTGTASLYSSDVTTGSPIAANVRYGTRYGATNEYTGTCQVPAAASVLYGVPVDNTTGTASLTNDPQLTPL